MNTKTSLKRVYNYYNGTDHGVGRDSPGALLDMLAEVASQTLHSEKKWTESSGAVQQSKSQTKSDSIKRKSSNQEPSFTSSQLLSMPATQLVKQFSVFTGDELKRQYSYTCALIPGCAQRYTSFASEGRARMSIKAHLADHLDYLKKDEEAYSTFTAVAVKHKNSKTNPGTKKPRVYNQQKKPAETLNKENKDTKSGKSTNYLRKILSNEMNFTEFEKEKTLAKINKNNDAIVSEIEKKTDDHTEFQVLGDHSYFGHAKVSDNDHKVNPDLGDIMVKEAMGENIMLMVVESDGVHMKELPCIAQDISVRTDQDENDGETIHIPESVSWSEEVYAKNMETSLPAKPKGKAKFIGTSKEEREMALALMERIKRKGNPGGGNLQCRICDPPRSFTAPTTLVSHYRSHAGIKPYECRICRAVFTRRHSLKYHMLIHQNQTRFTCTDCGKKFRHPSHFREHRRRHTGEAPFGCEDCGQRFKTRNTYKRHLKTRHGKVLTTTGELLHLSEEDFQKVRTNPKRRIETNYSESMIDEDITAPEVIIKLQNGEFGNDGQEKPRVKEEIEDNYRGLSNKENEDEEVNEFWGNENGVVEEEVEAAKEDDGYGDYEYFQESQVNKTDYEKTDINVDYENVENVVNQLRYSEEARENKEDKDEALENDCIGIDIREDNNMREIQLMENEENHFEEGVDPREEILYENHDDDMKKSNFIEYVDGIEVNECQEDVITYDDNIEALQEVENNYDLENAEEETENNYFHDHLNTDNEIEYKEVEQLDMERYEEINIVEDHHHISQMNIQDRSKSSEENEIDDKTGIEIMVENNDLPELTNDSEEELNENVSEYLLEGTEVVLEEDGTPEIEYRNRYLLEDKSSVINDQNLRANVAVERIVEYPTTDYEAEDDSQTPGIYSQTMTSTNPLPSNNIIIKNKDLVSLLSHHRIKLQQENPDQLGLPKSSEKVVTLLNSEPQSFNMIKNGKQSTILLLASGNEMKNNYLKIDSTNGVTNGIKTLPVIAVQQK